MKNVTSRLTNHGIGHRKHAPTGVSGTDIVGLLRAPESRLTWVVALFPAGALESCEQHLKIIVPGPTPEMLKEFIWVVTLSSGFFKGVTNIQTRLITTRVLLTASGSFENTANVKHQEAACGCC
jgi:hypothetical protein